MDFFIWISRYFVLKVISYLGSEYGNWKPENPISNTLHQRKIGNRQLVIWNNKGSWEEH